MGVMTDRHRTVRVTGDSTTARPDTLVVEEPLEIRLNTTALAVTMRTPGDDFELAAGFLVSEGVIAGPRDLVTIRHCAGTPEESDNIVDVTLAPGVPVPAETLSRHTLTTSACGLCGKASLASVRTTARFDVSGDETAIAVRTMLGLPDRLRGAQRVFARTGGLHAAGLFTPAGETRWVREDVGRHNAVDKLVGHAALRGLLPLAGSVLVVSGRASFELVQKAVMAGIPAMAAVSAPSTLAVRLAEDNGLTLAGFVRGDTMNVYAAPHRLGL